MCERCDEFGYGAHDFRLVQRPAHRLVGRFWEGGYGESAGEAIQALIAEMARVSAERSKLWRSPVVGISWNGGEETFRYFAGIVDDEAADGFEELDLPNMRFASSWYGAQDGDVLAHYRRMIEWVASQGFTHDRDVLVQREEYAPGAELAQPPELRIMLPVRGNVGKGESGR